MSDERGIDIDEKLGDLSRYLTERGLKSTRQRDLIARTVLEAEGHIGVEDIYRRVRKRDAKVGFSTVYRTMKLLKECGLVSERHFGDGLARYEPVSEDHHDHLICTRCGAIVEFEDAEIENLQDAVAERHGFTIVSHKHEIYGHCAACNAKSAPRPQAARPAARPQKRAGSSGRK